MKASRTGQFCTIKYLLSNYSASININRTTPGNEHSALSLACQNGHLQVVELLLQFGANALQALKDNSNCLIEASKGGHTKIVELLIDWNYTLNMSNSSNLRDESIAAGVFELMSNDETRELTKDELDEDEDDFDEDDDGKVCLRNGYRGVVVSACGDDKEVEQTGKLRRKSGKKLAGEIMAKTEPALIKQIKKSISRLDTTSGRILFIQMCGLLAFKY